MKKLFLMAATVGVALTSCVNDKLDNLGGQVDSQQKITFTNPVVGGAQTKAVPGEINTTTKYPTAEKFRVFAQWDKTSYVEWEGSGSAVYMNDVEVSHQATPGSNGAWYPATDYFWPREGVLSFWAASPSTELSGKLAYNKTNGIQIGAITIPANGFTKEQADAQADVASTQYDLMYAPIVKNQKKSTTTDDDSHYNGVDLAFKHALSLIKFDIKLKEAYTGTTIKLKRISISGINSKSAGFNENITGTPTWQTPSDTTSYEVANYPTGKQLANTPAIDVYTDTNINGKRLILMPQDIANEETTKIIIGYTVQSAGGAEIEQTIETKLYHGSLTKWEPGKAYFYHLILALDQIYFDPVASDWETDTNQDIEVPQA